MGTLLQALLSKNTLTENGMTTNSSSLNECVNLFFQIGAMRGKDKKVLINSFVCAYEENPLTAMKLLFWARDIRGGAGERQIFKDILNYLANTRPNSLINNLKYIPEYGRWDDLLGLIGSKLERNALELIKEGLENNNQLCAKWMPRPNCSNEVKRKQAQIIRNFLKLTPKEYRTLLVKGSNTVEQLMCSNNWGLIDYSKLPSKAMSDYMKAFNKRDTMRFTQFLEALKNGETKINASAVYPYDIVKNLRFGNKEGADAQWNALPNYMEFNNELILPVVDVSGSMTSSVGNNPNLECIDISISLGLYISERNIGPFKDSFITFSESPELQYLKGTLSERYSQLANSDWGMNTNLEAVFNLILNQAKNQNVPESEMPTMILILSDMEFDSAIEDSSNPTSFEMINNLYENHGYKIPKIVFWNLNAKNKNFPASFDENNTCLISGFSPSILKILLNGGDLTPISMMNAVINSQRYQQITI